MAILIRYLIFTTLYSLPCIPTITRKSICKTTTIRKALIPNIDEPAPKHVVLQWTSLNLPRSELSLPVKHSVGGKPARFSTPALYGRTDLAKTPRKRRRSNCVLSA
ncbi:hypothetical protein QQ045_030455 [Rhodiola kirilowii]